MNPTQQSSHQDKKHPHNNARQLAFTGLATATLIGGVGTTPVVLATQINDEKTELTTSTTATEAAAPVITTPAPLPEANLTPTSATNQAPTNQPAVEPVATMTDETTSEKQNKPAPLPDTDPSNETTSKNQNKSAPLSDADANNETTSEQAATSQTDQTLATKTKNKATRAATVFEVSDFVVVNNVITGLTDDGLDKVNDTNWDGDFTFPTGLENVTSFNSYIFGGQFLNGSPDYNAYKRTRSSLVTVDLSNLTGLTEIPDDGFNGNKLTTIKLGNLSNLMAVGQRAFFSCSNLQNFQYSSLPNLSVLGDSSFMYCTALTSFDFNDLPGLTTIQSNAFNASALNSINLSNLPLLATLGDSAFIMMGLLTTVTINNLPHLTTLTNNVFRYCNHLVTLNLTNLPALTTIGATAFFSDTDLETLDLSNLTALTTISDAAFLATGLQEVIVTNNPGLTIGTNAFVVLSSGGGIVTPINEAAVPTAIAIRDSINTDNAFADASAWYIPAKVTFKYVDQNNQPITKDANNNPLVATPLACHISDTFTPADAPVIAGYSNPAMIGDNPQTVQHLTQEITFKYEAAAAQAFTVSYVHIHGNPLVDPDTASGYVDDTLITDHYISDVFTLPSTTLATDNANYVYKELRRSNPNGGWDTIDQGDLPVTFGDNAGQNYQFVYAEMNSVTQQYVDENNQPINFSDHRTISAEDGTAYDYSFANDTDDYYANGAPKIVGYDEPVLVENSAPITGQISGDAQQVVTYQYKTIAKSGFIYRVDTDGNQLAAPEAFAGHISDQLDLNAAQQTFAGYQFTELYSGMPTLNRLLGVTDYTWETAHTLIGTTLTYGDNNGRSYKFVYTKNASNQAPDDSDTTTPPANKPSTGGSTSTPSQPTTSTPNQPAHLPTTGGNTKPKPKPKPATPAKKPTTQTPPQQLPTSGGKQPQTVMKVTPTSTQPTATTAKKLPQSGSARNYLLPVVGATLLLGLASLAAFSKRRQRR